MLCVLAKLDDEGTEKLAAIQRSAFPGGKGFKPLHGHITLASYEGDDEAGFVRSCRELLKDAGPFEVFYEKTELFDSPAIVVVKPVKSDVLLSLHRRIADRFGGSLNIWTKTERWNPHTTLYFDPDADMRDIYRKMSEAFVPFSAVVCRIEFSRVLEDGYEIIDTLDLASR